MENKFIWDEIKFVSSEVVKVEYPTNKKPFFECRYNQYCNNCGDKTKIATDISNTIFKKYCSNDMLNEQLGLILKNLIDIIDQFLPKEIVLTKGLYYCIKAHLLSIVDANTNISFSEDFYNKAFNIKKQ